MLMTTVMMCMRSTAMKTKTTIRTTMINTDQDEPDDNPRREKDGDAAMQAVIHAIPETVQPRVNEGRV